MKSIYLDHNVAHYFVRGFPKDGTYPEDVERATLTQALRHYPEVGFVLSPWNIVESAAERERDSDPTVLANRCADFFENLKPLHIAAHNIIERDEMKQCVWTALGLQRVPSEVPVFHEHLSQVHVQSGMTDAVIGYNIRKELTYLAADSASREGIRKSQQTALSAQKEVRKAAQDGRWSDPQLRTEILRKWFSSMVPERKPDAHSLILPERQKAVASFLLDPKVVFQRCPAIFVEDLLTDVRATAMRKGPRIQDTMDLMHLLVPLAYCDALVSNDRILLDCARQVIRSTGRSVVIETKLSETLKPLLATPR